MKITYDPDKRNFTLINREVDFEDAVSVFKSEVISFEDTRYDYKETRMICFGYLNKRLMMVGYVQRADARHVFTMRKANDRECKRYTP